MAGNYPCERLGELASVQGGYAFKSDDFLDAGTPVLKIKNVRLREIDTSEVEYVSEVVARISRRYFCRTGDILISMTGSGPQAPNSVVGRVARFTGPNDTYLINQRVGRFVIKEPGKLNPRFLFYFLTQSDIQSYLVSIATGSANQANISGGQIGNLEIPLPSLSKQSAIASILGALDDKIGLNRRMNETLEAMARAIFKSWFVDFDPVRTKAEGRQPLGMDAATAAHFPDSFQDSPLGKIPKGWKAGTIREIAGLLGGFAFRSQDWVDEGVPVVKIGSVKPGVVDLSNVSYVRPEVAEQAQRFRLKTGDLLIGMTGYVGEVGVVPPTGNRPLLNQRVGKFLLQGGPSESLPYVYCLTRRPDFKTQVEGRAHGTAQANVSAQALLGIDTIVPPVELRTKFNGTCRLMFGKILRNLAIDQTLIAIRDTLLPKLISGDIRVKDSEKLLEKTI